MAIPTHLERAILNGWAKYKIHHHAFSGYGRVPIPDNNLCYITQIIWYPFINPFKPMRATGLTFGEWFTKYCEYQLNLSSAMGQEHYIFRNNVKWYTNNRTVITSDTIVTAALIEQIIFEPGTPVIIDCYIPAQQYINIDITRNSIVNLISTYYQPLPDASNEYPPPTAQKGVPVGLNFTMDDVPGNTMEYNPAGPEISGLPLAPRTTIDYKMQVPVNSTLVDFGSRITPIETADTESVNSVLSPFITHPLVQLGIVYINKNNFDQVQNV